MMEIYTNKRNGFAGERSWIYSPDWNGKPTAERSEARTWNGKQDSTFCGFECSASNQFTIKSTFIIMVIAFCFFSADSKAQKNTKQLIEEIKILMPYREAKATIDYKSMPTKLSIKAAKYTELFNYSDYLNQSVLNGSFEIFSEDCLNHITSRKIKNPKDSSLFKKIPVPELKSFD